MQDWIANEAQPGFRGAWSRQRPPSLASGGPGGGLGRGQRTRATHPIPAFGSRRNRLSPVVAPAPAALGSRVNRSSPLRPPKQKAQALRPGLFTVGDSDDDLLSRGIPRTIIGAASFHGPVRDGKAWFQRAMVVREDDASAGSPWLVSRWLHRPVLEEVLGSTIAQPKSARTAKHACGYRIKPHGQLVPVSSTCCHASTPGLSTRWSSATLQGGHLYAHGRMHSRTRRFPGVLCRVSRAKPARATSIQARASQCA